MLTSIEHSLFPHFPTGFKSYNEINLYFIYLGNQFLSVLVIVLILQ